MKTNSYGAVEASEKPTKIISGKLRITVRMPRVPIRTEPPQLGSVILAEIVKFISKTTNFNRSCRRRFQHRHLRRSSMLRNSSSSCNFSTTSSNRVR